MCKMESKKAAVIFQLNDEIAAAIRSVDTAGVANRCWRSKCISDEAYKAVLKARAPEQTATALLLEAVQAGICEEERRFGDFVDILKDELQPDVAKSLITKILARVAEVEERAHIDQCTEDESSDKANNEESTTDSYDELSVVADSSESQFNVSGGSGESNSVSCTLRKRTVASPLLLSREQVMPEDRAEVVPIQETAGPPPLPEAPIQNRNESLRQAEENKFACNDKAQNEANVRDLTEQKEALKRQVEQQTIDYCNICDDKKRVEEELQEKKMQVKCLSKERDETIAEHKTELEHLRNCVAENERDRHQLEVKCKECENKLKIVTETYAMKISQCENEILSLQQKLVELNSTNCRQQGTIDNQNREIRKLSAKIIELNKQLQTKDVELEQCRHEVNEFKNNGWAMLIFVIIFLGLIEFLFKLGIIIGFYYSL